VDAPQQEILTKEVNALAESVKKCLLASGDRQDQLEKDLRSATEYAKLLEETKQLIASKSQWKEEIATNVPALKALILNLEFQLSSIRVSSRQLIATLPVRKGARLCVDQADQKKLEVLHDKAKEMEQRADVANRQMIQQTFSSVSQQWREAQDRLARKCSDLTDLAETWDVSR
jgi:ElaB/YqjD/DUF883 family membrane-anchored ribosome-binding protein